MQPLSAKRPEGAAKPVKTPRKPKAAKPAKPRDPAPSRWAYRFHRLWLTPLYRSLMRVGVPAFLFITAVGWYFSNPTNRFAIEERVELARRSVEERPEFMVKLMAIDGASPVVDEAIREMIPVDFPISSFDLDLEVMQATVAELDVIEDVAVRIRPGGVLEVRVSEREPVVIWRDQGGLDMLDATGHRVASLTTRSARHDLPLIVGSGAGDAVPEALRILTASAPIAPRVRGLVRVGARRWDVMLDRDQRVMLPENNPVAALEQVLALDEAQEVLARDVTDIDMRNPLRPTLRMTPAAVEELRHIRALSGDQR
ncbi:MAG: cell division protein FtsQ/DivIB [Maritimibacter sp.]